jgi:hypothetical protein
MIDMASYIENAPENVDDVVEINGEKKGFSYARRKYRPKDTALMLIYPINPKSHSKNSNEYPFDVKPINAKEIIFGVMFVFPESDKLAKGKFIINASIDNDNLIPVTDKNKKPKLKNAGLDLLFNDVASGRAISIRQPYVEEILLGKKQFEFRSRATKIRGRVFLYASNTLGDISNCKKFKINPETLTYGMIVGSIEIEDCVYFEEDKMYGYKLINPIRYNLPIKPDSHPQPLFFFPFGLQKVKFDEE